MHRGKTTITEPSICMSYRHRNHGAPCEVARDNIFLKQCSEIYIRKLRQDSKLFIKIDVSGIQVSIPNWIQNPDSFVSI